MLLGPVGMTGTTGNWGREQGINTQKQNSLKRKKGTKMMQKVSNSCRSSDKSHLSGERYATRRGGEVRYSRVSSWYSLTPHYPPTAT